MTGWDESAEAWIKAIGDRGDWSREWLLDPAMLAHIEGRGFRTAPDVGCGEGRFCRIMRERGIAATGIDPTVALVEAARHRDPNGDYRIARAEDLPIADASFDLVVSYVTLVDIAGYRAAIAEMTRVLRPGGTLLVANLNGFATAGPLGGWVRDAAGRRVSFPIDNYLEERADRVAWAGIDIENWHRPLSAYMSAFLDAGLQLRTFEEPAPVGGDPEHVKANLRVPWFVVMEWQKLR